MRATAPPGMPRYPGDMYSRAGIRDPYPHYRALRDLGPVVWLTRQRVVAVPRYAEARHVLSEPERYRSGDGVGLNCVVNRLSDGTTLTSDGEVHRARRRLVAHRLTPRALRDLQARVDDAADRTVRAAVARSAAGEVVDGVGEIALALPLSVVPDLVGWPVHGRAELLAWAGATFDLLGPANTRSVKALPAMAAMRRFVGRVVRDRDVVPGSMAADVLAAVDDGRVAERECPALMIDYMAPSIDTTAGAIAGALWLFATHRDQWELLRWDPGLVANAVEEIVRVESPLRAFSRHVTADTEIAGTPVPAGARVLVLYASANRDERRWHEPDRFDITRDTAGHLGFGYGEHGCAGQGLARMETQAVLRALLEHVEHIEQAGLPEVALNNIIHRHRTLPVRLVPRSPVRSRA